jgi:hypothetical protein
MRYMFTFVLACFYTHVNGIVHEKISLPVQYDGVESLLEASPNESAEVASRKWVMDHGLGKKIDVDNILRELVYHLRTAGAKSDAPDGSVIAPYLGAAIASVTVRAPLTNDGAGELGPPHTLSVLTGETPKQAIDGFLLRMGLPADVNRRLEANLLASIENNNKGSSGNIGIGSGSGSLSGSGSGNGSDSTDINEDEFEAPLPTKLGVSLNVTFDRESGNPGRRKQTIHVRYGENAIAAAELFLIGAGVTDPTARAVARKSIVDKLLANAADHHNHPSLKRFTAEKSLNADDVSARNDDDDDVIARSALIIPLSVGTLSFDVNIEVGSSLRGAARVFCSRQWEVLRLPLKLAAVKWRRNDSITTGSSYKEPTINTCASIVFAVFRDFYTDDTL